MNDIIKSLFDRKSVRVFERRRIPEDDRRLVMESALQAPTAGNQMLYAIIDVEEQAVKDELAVLCDNQPFIATAPMALVFVADAQRWLDAYRYAKAEHREPGYGDILLSCVDAVIAAHNTVVAAESLGLGSCYIGDILENKEKVVELLGLEKYQIPVAMVVYGYPTEQQKNREKPKRFGQEYIVHKNRYRRLTESEIRAMFEERSAGRKFGFEEDIQAFCKRKYMSDFAIEFERSVRSYFEEFEPNR